MHLISFRYKIGPQCLRESDKPLLTHFCYIDIVSISRHLLNAVSIPYRNWTSVSKALLLTPMPGGDRDASLTADDATCPSSFSRRAARSAWLRWPSAMPLRRGPGGNVDVGRFHEPGIHHGSYAIGRNYTIRLLFCFRSRSRGKHNSCQAPS